MVYAAEQLFEAKTLARRSETWRDDLKHLESFRSIVDRYSKSFDSDSIEFSDSEISEAKEYLRMVADRVDHELTFPDGTIKSTLANLVRFAHEHRLDSPGAG